MIRTVTPGDTSAVVGLALSSGLFPAEEVDVVQKLIDDYFGGKQNDGHACLLDEDTEPVAVAYYEPAVATDGTWYLTMIGVRSDRQGIGRGAALLRHVEDDLRGSGQRLLLVETSGVPSFDKTRAFYAKCGYEHEATVRNYYEPGDDMVLFSKPLSA